MDEIRQKLIDMSMPVFAEYDRDRRNFFSSLAAMSATIGAFSFLLFNPGPVIKNQNLLKIGDGLLLGTITVSVIIYLFILSDSQRGFHKTFYDFLEIFNEKQFDKIPKYKRPEIRSYLLEMIACGIFVLALIFIGLIFV